MVSAVLPENAPLQKHSVRVVVGILPDAIEVYHEVIVVACTPIGPLALVIIVPIHSEADEECPVCDLAFAAAPTLKAPAAPSVLLTVDTADATRATVCEALTVESESHTIGCIREIPVFGKNNPHGD
jgi:hypothetical protein